MGFDVVELQPRPALRGIVRRAADFHEAGPPVRRVERPLVGAVLIVSLGPDMLVDDRRVGSFAAGLWDRPTFTGHDGAQAGYQVELALGAARALLGMPLAELANTIAPLDAVLGDADARELQERVAAAPDAAGRHAAAQDLLTRRALGAVVAPVAPEVLHAVRRLRATRGAVRIEALAAETGWSRRHLAARVRAELGLSPKALARVLRMEHAVGRLVAGASLADVAFEAGFADQPHFTREFRALVGCAPTDFPFVQDALAAA